MQELPEDCSGPKRLFFASSAKSPGRERQNLQKRIDSRAPIFYNTQGKMKTYPEEAFWDEV
ncbi:MAG: hypothetical protein U0L91_05035 [Gemmiger sp.]|uniref:hypothetical protein n=1 Tax=Gemmiger sp. TaxID=2049027 RepID=UPI002E7A5F70|nr:hypothetical protein [Gemmiger sp.]MEE0800626.1 hypothetical protein [Gemmiger sp.]